MNRLALGTAQFGLTYGVANHSGQVSFSTAKEMLRLAASNGVDTLDTAIAYGQSEVCLGNVGTEGYKIVSKLPALPEFCDDINAWVHGQLTSSLARLGVGSIYGLLLHRPEQLLEVNGTALYKALLHLKDVGLVQKVGVSIYDPAQLSALITRYSFDLVQAPLNLVDRRLEFTGWLQRLEDEGIEVHTRSAFLQGLLLISQADLPDQFLPWADLWNRWHLWLRSHDISAVQACLAYPLSLPGISRIIVGADSASQLSEIINAGAGNLLRDFPDLSCVDEDLINPTRWIFL